MSAPSSIRAVVLGLVAGAMLGAISEWILDREGRRRSSRTAGGECLTLPSVAAVAHDLRGSLTSLELAVELLSERIHGRPDRQDDRITRLLGIATDDVVRIRSLVDDLTVLGRLESGAHSLEPTAVDPGELVRRSLDATLLEREDLGMEITVELDGPLPPVLADAIQIERALTNLLRNAMRHAKPGGRVIVGAEAVADHVRFFVADAGSGLQIADQERVFEPFVGEGSGRDHAGLGLAIVREIVTAHRGRAWVDSRPGPGAVFNFILARADRPGNPT